MRGRRRDLNLEAYSESRYPERLGWSPLRALRDGRFKLIDAPRPELYDLERDPFEEQNIYDEHRGLAKAMTTRAAVVAKGRGSPPAPEGRTRVTPELQARLAALGYLGSGLTREPRGHAGLQATGLPPGFSHRRLGADARPLAFGGDAVESRRTGSHRTRACASASLGSPSYARGSRVRPRTDSTTKPCERGGKLQHLMSPGSPGGPDR